MTSEEIRQEAEEHCNEVMCTVCENKTCTERKIKCREWRDRCAGYYCGAEPREEQIRVLKKENAGLKSDYEVLSCSVGDFGELQDKLEEEQRKNNGLSDNLTKAKEIIREIMKYEIPTLDYEKAEQFLKEIEK